MRQILHGPRPQAKLTVGPPGDVYEREADQVADAVMRMPEPEGPGFAVSGAEPPRIQRLCAECEEETKVQRLCSHCEEELHRVPEDEEGEKELQREESSPDVPEVTPDLETRIRSLHAGGQALSASSRAFFEPRFGHDFSAVRLHADPAAGEVANALRAKAFTTGPHIVFAGGQYAPESGEGQRLLAHELTHVVQQRQAADAGGALVQRHTTRGAGGCGPLTVVDEDLEGARGAGATAHIQIQAFLARNGVLSELRIPRATKHRMSDRGCQPVDTEIGRADLWRPGRLSRIAEIKPFSFANLYGVTEAEHYILRANQSFERLAIGGGGCSYQRAGADDRQFRQRAGTTPRNFDKLTGILTADTTIGRFDGDPSRTLKARMVAPGAVGYWCTGGGADTYTCGVSQRETENYLDRVLLPAQDVLDRFIRDRAEQPLEQAMQRMDLASVFAAAERYLGPRIRETLHLSWLNRVLPQGSTLEVVGRLLDQALGPAAREVLLMLARHLKSLIINELRLQLRNSLRDLLRGALAALCVGAPVVTLAALLDRLMEELRRRARLLAPVIIRAVVARFATEMLRAMGDLLARVQEALGRVVRAVLDVLLRLLAAVAVIVLVVGVTILAVLAFLAIFDPVPGDEVAAGAGAAALAGLIPSLLTFIYSGDLPQEPNEGGA